MLHILCRWLRNNLFESGDGKKKRKNRLAWMREERVGREVGEKCPRVHCGTIKLCTPC